MDTIAVLTLSHWIRPRVSSPSHILLRRHSNSSPLALITRVPQGYAIRSLSMISFSSSPILRCCSIYLTISVDPTPFLLWLAGGPTACSACSQFMKPLVTGEKSLHLQPLMPLRKDVPILLLRHISDASLSLTKCSSKILVALYRNAILLTWINILTKWYYYFCYSYIFSK